MLAASLEVWKSVEIGNGPNTIDELRRALKGKGRVVNRTADAILGQTVFSRRKTRVVLVKKSLEEVGFTDGVGYGRFCTRVKELKLGLCQPEAIAKLCLQDLTETEEPYLIAMEPVNVKDPELQTILRIFFKDGVLWLGTASFPPEAILPPDSMFILRTL